MADFRSSFRVDNENISANVLKANKLSYLILYRRTLLFGGGKVDILSMQTIFWWNCHICEQQIIASEVLNFIQELLISKLQNTINDQDTTIQICKNRKHG